MAVSLGMDAQWYISFSGAAVGAIVAVLLGGAVEEMRKREKKRALSRAIMAEVELIRDEAQACTANAFSAKRFRNLSPRIANQVSAIAPYFPPSVIQLLLEFDHALYKVQHELLGGGYLSMDIRPLGKESVEELCRRVELLKAGLEKECNGYLPMTSPAPTIKAPPANNTCQVDRV